MNRRYRVLGLGGVLACISVLAVCLPIVRELLQTRKDAALIAAIKAANDHGVIELLRDGASANARDIEERPTLALAIRRIVGRFRGQSASRESPRKPSALSLAVGGTKPWATERRFDWAIAEVLLDNGANPNDAISLDANDETMSETVLMYAASARQDALVRLLLERGADPNQPDSSVTPLMWADAESSMVLLAHGANINARDGYGNTALMWAVLMDDPARLRLLLGHGADVFAKNAYGETALTLSPATAPHHSEVTALLRHQGAK